MRGGGDDGAGARPREEEGEVGPGDQEVEQATARLQNHGVGKPSFAVNNNHHNVQPINQST